MRTKCGLIEGLRELRFYRLLYCCGFDKTNKRHWQRMAGINSLCVLGQSISIAEVRQKAPHASKARIMKNTSIEKIYTATGQAPSPSKDFFELVVAKDRIIWRAWRIKYKNHRTIMPSEDSLTYEDYQYDGRVQTEVNRNLGDDVLQISLAYASKQWLSRMPMRVLLKIASFLTIKEICNMSQVSISFDCKVGLEEQ